MKSGAASRGRPFFVVSPPSPIMTDAPTARPPALVVFAALAVVPWLLPVHQAPWPTFHSEAAMAAAFLVPAAWLVMSRSGPWPVGMPEACLLALAGVPLLQAAAGMYVHPAEASLVGACLVAFAMAVILGRRAQEAVPFALADGLFVSVTLAALMSAGLAAYQWLELDGLGLLVGSLGPDGRIRANVGHPNNLSTLLAWGLVGLCWLRRDGRLGAATAFVAALLMLLGLALTQSRTGWLQVALLAGLALLWRQQLGDRIPWRAALALAALFALMVLALEPLGRALAHDVSRTLEHQTEAGKRPQIWAMALEGVVLQPWRGYGWNQGVLAHVAVAEHYPDLHVAVGHAHNIALDLLLWNGVPLGLALCVGSLLWWRNRLREPRTARQALLLAALSVFVLHALLELPHLYAFFYLPVGLLIGTLAGTALPAPRTGLPRVAVGIGFSALAAWLLAAMTDYVRIEEQAASYRLYESRIGLDGPPPISRPLVLISLQQMLLAQRVEPRSGMSDDEIDHMRATALRVPTVGLLFRYAKASALNASAGDAAWALSRLCAMHRAQECLAARRDWCQAARHQPELRAIHWPAEPAEHSPAKPAQPNQGMRIDCDDH